MSRRGKRPQRKHPKRCRKFGKYFYSSNPQLRLAEDLLEKGIPFVVVPVTSQDDVTEALQLVDKNIAKLTTGEEL